MQKPWFRSQTGWWYCYVEIDGQRCQRKLAKGRHNEAAAWEALRELEKGNGLLRTAMTVAEACDEFLDWSSRENKPETYAFYRHYLEDFCRHDGKRYAKLKVSDLIPNHITRWLAKKTWNSTTRNRAISCVKRAINWCVDEGLIPTNPIAKVRKPRIKRREKILTDVERQRIWDAVPDEAFRQFLFALGQTGARPIEIRTVTAADVRDGYWEFEGKTTGRTGELRCIYLTPAMAELTAALCRRHPEGPLFRNTRGQPWTRNAVRIRFRNLRKRLNLDAKVCAYAFRHSWITGALERGLPIATVSALAGHADTKMVSTVYNHLNQQRRHLREAATLAVPEASLPQS